ncbi:MAG: 4-hydroxythreonine-4-phosphate dehydrogenase PdxA [Deltaproteobacteria bacterium]|jgi:4-hydroxythreonine-4-phosphate dehydrogenase|nr:4-hydroxythreonine-4-phosphate dehydrogenase PdxA [Deltaproteobacteria bacterium]
MKRPKIGITMGDAAGIGPEIVAKTASGEFFTKIAQPVIIGDQRVFKMGQQIAKVEFDFAATSSISEALAAPGLALLNTGAMDASQVTIGQKSVEYGREAAENLKQAVEFCRHGLLDGVCFAPNNKASMKEAGFKLHGVVDLLKGFFESTQYASELGVLNNIWTARVTSHIPSRDIYKYLTLDNILRSVRLLDKAQRLAGFAQPRIAVAAFNPHAGENGTCGREEIEVIGPAVEQARAEKIEATGPWSADTLFMKLFRGDFDGAVSMYHDQGQIAMKLQGFDNGVTVFAGLPAPVTTASHGTAYDIAGQGKAQSGAWEQAYRMAARMAANNTNA